MTTNERTTILVRRAATSTDADIGHYLTVVQGAERGRRHELRPGAIAIGRQAPCEIVLPDSEISRKHCSVGMFGGEAHIVDENSTNGTFVQGAQVTETVRLVHGALIQIGSHVLRYERLSRAEVSASDDLGREMTQARRYLEALLPAPIAEGPVTTAWLYLPSTQLGGDGFGYRADEDGTVSIYLLDIAGHGAGAAMHAVAVLSALRRKALPGADFSRPDEVVSRLNAMFPAEEHNDMFFTLWYGVYDPATRRLDYCSAGHHPAFLRRPDGGALLPLRTPGLAVGADVDFPYAAASVQVPAGATLYVFSDGVFEVTTPAGADWSLQDFVRLLEQPPGLLQEEPMRLLQGVQASSRPGGFDDDFTLLVAQFQ